MWCRTVDRAQLVCLHVASGKTNRSFLPDEVGSLVEEDERNTIAGSVFSFF